MSLIFVTGKGGVGKSAITAALAKNLSQKQKVGIVELNQTRMASFFDVAPPSYQGIKKKNLTLFNLDPLNAFEEYTSQILPRHFLFFVRNRWIHHFIHAVPGLNEILMLGKLLSLLRSKKWDTLFLDAPATGHTIALCKAPQIAKAALKQSPLRKTIENILEFLKDPKQTSFYLVTQPEESIVQETIELHNTLIHEFQFSITKIFVNRTSQEHLILHKPCIENTPKPFLKMSQWIETKQKEEKDCLKTLESLALPLEKIPVIENTNKESQLIEKLAKEIKI